VTVGGAVATGEDVASGAGTVGVMAGDNGVSVGARGVFVGTRGVFVGAATVLVGASGVFVGAAAVFGGTGVFVGDGVGVGEVGVAVARGVGVVSGVRVGVTEGRSVGGARMRKGCDASARVAELAAGGCTTKPARTIAGMVSRTSRRRKVIGEKGGARKKVLRLSPQGTRFRTHHKA
jgi:hypothetical protein